MSMRVKFESRISKFETNSKSVNGNAQNERHVAFFGICLLGHLELFRASDFEFRILKHTSSIFIVFLLCACIIGKGADMEQLKEGFVNPGVEYRPLPMEFDYAKPAEFADELSKGKWGGSAFNYPHGGPTYLQDQAGWDTFLASVKACKDKGLLVWIYDEMGYPSGRAGGLTLKDHPEYEAQGLFYDSTDILASDAEEIEWKLPAGKPFYVAICPVYWDGTINADNAIDVTDKVADGVLKIKVEEGVWRIMAFVQNRLYEGTHATVMGGAYPNLMDPDAVKRFIDITYAGYYSHCGDEFGKTIKAIFTDEPSVIGGFLQQDMQPHPALSWYHGLPEIFEKRAGYDIRKVLPALFNQAGAETIRRRCDFYSTIAETIGENYFGQIGDWCRAHNIAFTGHLVWEESLIYHANFYGSIFPSLEQMDWPGIDVLGCNYGCTSGAHTEGGPVTPKLISSVAHLFGKKRTISESFCFVTNKTPIEDLIAHVNWQWVLGINSLTVLSIWGQYPMESFQGFNDYVGRLSYMLTQGRPVADVAVLYPIASVWADFKPTNRHVSYLDDNPKAKDVDDAWREVSKELLSCPRDFDYVDEDLLTNARISGDKLVIGKNSYSILVLPHVTTLRYSTLKQIEKFAAGGGKVISFETLPSNREDAGSADEFRALVEKVWEKVTHVETLDSLAKALAGLGHADVQITPRTKEVYYQHRALADGDIYFLVNNSKEPVSGKFTFRATGKAQVWDPKTGEMKPMKGSSLTLAPRSGVFVVMSDK